jgi:lysophospholipase L1-like esterase
MFNEQWQKEVSTFEEIAPFIKPKPIVLFGDSHAGLYRINEFIPGKYCINRGIMGDTTDGMLNRLQTSVIDINAAKLFILAGSNDIPLHDDKTIISNYREIIVKTILNLPACEIFIISLFPTRHSDVYPNNRIVQINAELADLAKHFEIGFINFHSILCDDDNQLKLEFSSDGLQLNQSGYNLLSKFLKSHL